MCHGRSLCDDQLSQDPHVNKKDHIFRIFSVLFRQDAKERKGEETGGGAFVGIEVRL